MNIGDRIKARRMQLGLSQEEVAVKLGYKSRSTINKIELGINDITQSKVVSIAKALDTTPAYLMGWDDEKNDKIEKTPVPISEDRQDRNIIKIAGRDGSFVERELTDDQITLMKNMLDQLKPIDSENI